MRKHQEGYVLIYVMVALVLLSLLGAVSCSIAVSNLEAQRSSIDRMCDEYAAEGVVEQTRATLNGYTYSGEESTYYNTADAAQENATANFRATLDGIANSLKENPADTTEASPLKGNWNDATISWSKVSDNECTGTVELTLTTDQPDSTVAVETTVELTLTLELTAKYNSTTVNESENPDPKFLGYTYTVTVGSPKYTSFTHTTVDANESENQASTEPQTSDAKISVSANASGDAVCEASGSIYLTVGESYKIPVEFAEELSKNVQVKSLVKSNLQGNLQSKKPNIATCQSLEVIGVSAGDTTVTASEYGISIPVYVTNKLT